MPLSPAHPRSYRMEASCASIRSSATFPRFRGASYPTAHVLCLYWHEPPSNCSRLSTVGRKLLAPFSRLPLRYEAPTVPVAVRYRSQLLRYADGNIFAALELAIERPAVPRLAAPRNAIKLFAPTGVYTPARLFSLGRSAWCYLVGNLKQAPASVIEAETRIC
jgi:hypothetical protein